MENQEVKHPYTKPEIEVINLDQAPQLLALSNPLGKNYPGEGR